MVILRCFDFPLPVVVEKTLAKYDALIGQSDRLAPCPTSSGL